MLSLLFAMTMIQDPVGPLPTKNQMDWHERQYYAFVHFGPNTFTGVEWGQGDEDPEVFFPSEFDARQWCRVFKEAGMTGVIITAKHHDGFALWPSKYTTHSVASSKWRDGKGDVLKDLSEACKEYGLWMGVYLSPWDRNHPSYGTPEYNDVFVNMLEEVLTNYGDMKEVWFDGANGEGPNGKRQVYDWPRFEATVREFAPNAVIFGDGGDVRWVGNESGFVGDTNWNFLPAGHNPGDQSIYKFLFEGDPNGDKYSPGECDVSIRPGWFWRESENDRVKNIELLKEIYYRSIGHGGNLLLNVPPDSRGLIHENDVKALMEFRRWRDDMFVKDLAKGAAVIDNPKITTGSSVPTRVVDGHVAVTGPPLRERIPRARQRFEFNDVFWIDHIVIRENLEFGQRIQEFALSTFNDSKTSVGGGHRLIATGTTVGYKRIIKLPKAIKSDHLILGYKTTDEKLTDVSVEVYLGLPTIELEYGQEAFMGVQMVAFKSNNSGAEIRYTLDGSEPTESSTQYTVRIKIDKTTTVKAIALYNGRKSFETVEQTFTHYAKQDLWPSIHFFKAPEPGIAYKYIEQGWQTLDQMKDVEGPPLEVSTTGLDLNLRKRDEHFGFRFQGVITARKDGIYIFDLTSDDGSRLYIDDKLVIDNDGLHGMVTKQGMAPLAKGFHMIKVEYFNATGGTGLKLEMQGPGITKHEMKSEEFKH